MERSLPRRRATLLARRSAASCGELATRLAGSRRPVRGRDARPSRRINFVVAHDGFTLADLVSYERKHNEANGEDNRDGTDANYSWNNGVEGPTDDPAILARAQRDQRGLLATLLLARGTPMLAMGAELGHRKPATTTPMRRTIRPRGSTGRQPTPPCSPGCRW